MSFYAASLNAVLWAQAECDKLHIPHKVLADRFDLFLLSRDIAPPFCSDRMISWQRWLRAMTTCRRWPIRYFFVRICANVAAGARQAVGGEQGCCATGGAQEAAAAKSFWQGGKSLSCSSPRVFCRLRRVGRCPIVSVALLVQPSHLAAFSAGLLNDAGRRFKPRSFRRRSKRRGMRWTASLSGERTARAAGFKVVTAVTA
jgi:hypothetical protein